MRSVFSKSAFCPILTKLWFVKTDPPAFIPGHAHLLIDPQRQFSDPKYDGTMRLSGKKSPGKGNQDTLFVALHNQVVVSEFRRVNLRNYIVYTSYYDSGYAEEEGGLFLMGWQEGDPRPIDKGHDSAFTNPSLERKLKRAGITDLWLSGFNVSQCVFDSAKAAIELGFRVHILSDCVANGRLSELKPTKEQVLERMQNIGMSITTSNEAIKFFERQKPSLEPIAA